MLDLQRLAEAAGASNSHTQWVKDSMTWTRTRVNVDLPPDVGTEKLLVWIQQVKVNVTMEQAKLNTSVTI